MITTASITKEVRGTARIARDKASLNSGQVHDAHALKHIHLSTATSETESRHDSAANQESSTEPIILSSILDSVVPPLSEAYTL